MEKTLRKPLSWQQPQWKSTLVPPKHKSAHQAVWLLYPCTFTIMKFVSNKRPSRKLLWHSDNAAVSPWPSTSFSEPKRCTSGRTRSNLGAATCTQSCSSCVHLYQLLQCHAEGHLSLSLALQQRQKLTLCHPIYIHCNLTLSDQLIYMSFIHYILAG